MAEIHPGVSGHPASFAPAIHPHLSNLIFLPTSPPLPAFDRFEPTAENVGSISVQALTHLITMPPIVSRVLFHLQGTLREIFTFDFQRTCMGLLVLSSHYADKEVETQGGLDLPWVHKEVAEPG